MATAVRPTKLGRIIGRIRRKIERFLPAVERRAETNAIAEKMRALAGKQLHDVHDDTLQEVIHGALTVAAHAEAEIKRNPSLCTAQPDEQAACFIRDSLQMDDLLADDDDD